MAVSGELKAEGFNQLSQKMLDRVARIEQMLDMRLMQLAEEAVTFSKQNKGYKDRTANLKNSISFALYRDGQQLRIHEGRIPKPEESERGQGQVRDALERYAKTQGVEAAKGYALVIVAGMEYAPYVEHRGYNVLYLTRHFLKKELESIEQEIIEILKS